MSDSWDDAVRELAGLVGIERRYRDALGHEVETPIGSMRSVLGAMGYDSDSPDAIRESVASMQTERASLVRPLIVISEGNLPRIPLNRPDSDHAEWQLEDEAGSISHGRGLITDDQIELPELASGYYRAKIEIGNRSADTTIIVAPDKCWHPDGERQRWGTSGPVYGIASTADLGIGDFGDLAAIARTTAGRGASFFGMSPVHALFGANRTRISPYSPSSRLFLDPIYIDPRQITGQEQLAQELIARAAGDGVLSRLHADPLVQYDAVWSLKYPILKSLWSAFRDAGGSTAFDRFRAERGVALARHATFEAFAEKVAEQGLPPYDDMPSVTSAEITTFQAAEADAVAFHAWLQWVADAQLSSADQAARDAGMDIGLIADLAVGAAPGGSEVWAAPESYLTGLSVGAPPDALAPHGQNWALRALDPIAMKRNGMAGLRALVWANMRHAGGIRIDHAFQLRRLFLIPDGMDSSAGAYLEYPADAMLAVLRIESHRARCMVIGEDLGTSPPNFSETLRSSGILGYRVLYFEHVEGGAFRPPAAYDADAMAVINTHDLATLRGWWRGLDIEERLRCGVTDAADAEMAHRERETDKHRLIQLLRDEGLFRHEALPDDAPIEAAMHLIARCQSELVGVQLDDIVGSLEQQNVPGVIDGVPNWRRRLPLTIADLASTAGPLDRLAQAMAAEGRGPNPKHRPN